VAGKGPKLAVPSKFGMVAITDAWALLAEANARIVPTMRKRECFPDIDELAQWQFSKGYRIVSSLPALGNRYAGNFLIPSRNCNGHRYEIARNSLAG
jgi:hypothetical protein